MTVKQRGEPTAGKELYIARPEAICKTLTSDTTDQVQHEMKVTGVVLFVRVLAPAVEVERVLVQRLNAQLEILRASLNTGEFTPLFLLNAAAVLHILNVAVATNLPRAVLEDSVQYVSRTLAHLASILSDPASVTHNFALILESLIRFLKESRK